MTPQEEATLRVIAAKLHDARCGCDRRYRNSCGIMPACIFEAAEKMKDRT